MREQTNQCTFVKQIVPGSVLNEYAAYPPDLWQQDQRVAALFVLRHVLKLGEMKILLKQKYESTQIYKHRQLMHK